MLIISRLEQTGQVLQDGLGVPVRLPHHVPPVQHRLLDRHLLLEVGGGEGGLSIMIPLRVRGVVVSIFIIYHQQMLNQFEISCER